MTVEYCIRCQVCELNRKVLGLDSALDVHDQHKEQYSHHAVDFFACKYTTCD